MKPILFNTDMVRAILDGRKTVTRRVIKSAGDGFPPATPSPYQPGDILWVRETWARSMAGTYLYKATDTPLIIDRWYPSIHMPKEAARLFLRVTRVRAERLQEITEEGLKAEGFLYDETDFIDGLCAMSNFLTLWNSTIKPANLPIYGWGANPLVWVIEFERCKREAHRMATKKEDEDNAGWPKNKEEK